MKIIISKNRTQWKKTKHEPSLWAVFKKWKENKLDHCRRKDCIEKLCKKLKKRAMKIINYEKKEMIPLTYDKNEGMPYLQRKVLYG